MKKRRLILIMIGLFAMVGVTVFVWPGEREPEYQGRKLSEWVEIYEDSFHPINGVDDEPPPETAERREAVKAARSVRDKLLPRAVKMISYRKPKWEDSVEHFMERKLNVRSWCPLWIWGPFYGDRGEDNMVYFQMLGPDAAPAVPELTRILKQSEDTRARERAMSALASIGKEGLPPLMQVMNDRESYDRRKAAFAIGIMNGDAAIPAVPMLVGYLKDPDENSSSAAATILGQLALEAEIVVPALTNCLHSTNAYLCESALEALGKFGQRARCAAPRLVLLLSNTNGSVSWEATNALRKIAPELLTTNSPPQDAKP